MHKIRKIAHAAPAVTITIVDMNKCILRACDVFWLVFADCAQCVFGQNAYTAQWILAKMHIPRYTRFAHCAQCCFGQNAYTALWAALRIARNAHLTDCAQCVLAILVLSAHMARYMQNRELPRARDAQAKILQCCVAVDGGGLVLVGEWGNARVSVFREEEGEGGRHAFVRCLGGADVFGADAATGAIAVYSDAKGTAWVQAGPGAPLALPPAAATAS